MAELRDYQKNNPKRNITLGIHLGNTQKVSNSLCADAAYENHAYLLSKGPRPTFVTPGNNDWFDCPRREEAFGLFMKHLGPDFISKWHAEHYENLGVERSGDNPELFRLYVEGILFIGVHMIDGPANQESEPSFNKRMKTSMEWFAQSVETSFAEREIRGVIVMGNAGRSERTQPFFAHMNKYFVGIGSRENVPVIYLHGNGLAYKFDRSFSRQSGWDAFYDIQIDRGALTEPCIIDVAPRKNGTVQELETGRDESMIQSVIEDGLFRLDQQRGRYPDPMDIPT